jgi:hypothetical protein
MTKATVGIRVFLTAGLLVLGTAMPAVAGQPTVRYTTQTVKLAPFEQSRTFTLKGRSTSAGCAFSYPDVTVPAGSDRWQVRDIGIDLSTCTKLVEEGVPTVSSADSDPALTTVSSSVGNQTKPASPAALVTHSGYASARFENIYGQTLTKDTTHITWGISSGCVTDGSVMGEWTWNHVYYSIVSNNGSESRTCSRELGTTWSSFRNNISGCIITFTAVRAYGWNDGTISGNRDDSSGCAPVWEHFDVVKTT